LLFQVFAERYERRSLLVTSNLPFGEGVQVFQGERMTAALLDRLTHRCHILEMNSESYRQLLAKAVARARSHCERPAL
jgi:DNA replication protein DnaC